MLKVPLIDDDDVYGVCTVQGADWSLESGLEGGHRANVDEMGMMLSCARFDISHSRMHEQKGSAIGTARKKKKKKKECSHIAILSSSEPEKMELSPDPLQTLEQYRTCRK